MAAQPGDILSFWRSAGSTKWFARSEAFDNAIRLKFEPVHLAAARGQYMKWQETPDGALALLILLDQFPRNLYRNSAHAFATDPLARAITRRAIERGFDKAMDTELRPFFYLPFEHSESLDDQELGVTLCQAHAAETGDNGYLKFAVIHRDIIARFGRFPHRNPMLGRETEAEEQAFLDDGGFAG
jgi:uncharacterized protein (DUF924 family)